MKCDLTSSVARCEVPAKQTIHHESKNINIFMTKEIMWTMVFFLFLSFVRLFVNAINSQYDLKKMKQVKMSSPFF